MLNEVLSGPILSQNTLGGLILAFFFTIIGVILKNMLTNHGNIRVAQINSDTTLGSKAMETLTTALEVLQEENRSLKSHVMQLESHIETLIDHILKIVKAKSQEQVDSSVTDLQQFLRSIGRWPH